MSGEGRKRYLSWAVSERRRKLKEMAVAYKGGACLDCGYSKCMAALQFHHRDPKAKKFAFSLAGVTRSWAKLKVELDKCDLVCANCHAERHDAEANVERTNKEAEIRILVPKRVPAVLEHGTRKGYVTHSCRCSDCCKANTEYHRNFRSDRGLSE